MRPEDYASEPGEEVSDAELDAILAEIALAEGKTVEEVMAEIEEEFE